ncbi:MAG: HD domain-containing protein [Spirochaetia bacterium]
MLWSQETYIKTLRFAAFAHRDQLVPGTPHSYLVHLASVCMEVMAVIPITAHINGDLAIQCALLHDVLEDTKVTPVELQTEFGLEVYKSVAALTKSALLPKAKAMHDSLTRILEEAPEVGMVKMADRITNLQQPPGDWSREKILYYREEAQLILESLRHLSQPLGDRLASKIANYDSFIEKDGK